MEEEKEIVRSFITRDAAKKKKALNPLPERRTLQWGECLYCEKMGKTSRGGKKKARGERASKSKRRGGGASGS